MKEKRLKPNRFYTKRIKDFYINGGSGLAEIEFMDGSIALIESGFGLRQIAGCFGSLSNAIGKKILFKINEWGVMAGFSPVL
jgi:hypothetical protein